MPPARRGYAVLAPGYGADADQPLLVKLSQRLEAIGIVPSRVTFSTRGRTKPPYEAELADLRGARDALVADSEGPIALVGRSFGGRMCTFLAYAEPPDALVVLGHPISPPGRPRPRDEAALAAVRCPTLIVQGERDELGPVAVLERIAGANPRIDLVVIDGAGHSFGRHEPAAIDATIRWLEGMLC